MKNYIIAAINSAGVVHSYIGDENDKLMVGADIALAKAYLELLQTESPYWADHRVIELVVV